MSRAHDPSLASQVKPGHLRRRWRLPCAPTWRTHAAPPGAAWDVGGTGAAHRTHTRGARPKSQLRTAFADQPLHCKPTPEYCLAFPHFCRLQCGIFRMSGWLALSQLEAKLSEKVSRGTGAEMSCLKSAISQYADRAHLDQAHSPIRS